MSGFKTRTLVTLLFTTPVALSLFIHAQERKSAPVSALKASPIAAVQVQEPVVATSPLAATPLIAKCEGDLALAHGDTDRALLFYFQGLDKESSSKQSDERLKSQLLLRIGNCYAMQGKQELAHDSYVEGLAKVHSDQRLYAYLHGALGKLLASQGSYGASLQHYQLAVTQQCGNKEYQTQLYATIGKSLYQMGRYEEALSPLQTAIERGATEETDYFVGQSLLCLGRYKDALSYLKKAESSFKTQELAKVAQVKARDLLSEEISHQGEVAVAEGNTDSAISHFEEALSLQPTSVEIKALLHARLGDLYFNKNSEQSLDLAQSHYLTALSTATSQKELLTNVHVCLAELFLLKNQKESASEHYESALLELDPSEPLHEQILKARNQISHELAEVYLDQGEAFLDKLQAVQAENFFNKVLELNGLDEEFKGFASFRLAECSLMQKQFAKAVKHLENAQNSPSQDLEFKQATNFLLAEALEKTGRFDKASETFEKALQLFRGDAQKEEEIKLRIANIVQLRIKELIRSGNKLLKEGKTALATERFKSATSLKPADPLVRAQLHHGIGIALLTEENYRQAQHQFFQALTEKFDNVQLRASLHHKLGIAFEKSGNAVRAEKEYEKALSLKPEDALFCAITTRALANLAIKQGKENQATIQLESALNYSFNNPLLRAQLHYQIGKIHVNKDSFEQAALQFKLAAEQSFTDDLFRAKLLIHLGEIMKKLGKDGEVVAYYKKAAKLNVDNSLKAKILYNLALNLRVQGEHTASAGIFNKALEMSAEDETLQAHIQKQLEEIANSKTGN